MPTDTDAEKRGVLHEKKFIEVTFDGVETFDYPIDWFDKLVDEKRYFQLLGIYEKEVGDSEY